MPTEDLWAKAREFRRVAAGCGDLVVYQALLDLAEAYEALAEEEEPEAVSAAGQKPPPN